MEYTIASTSFVGTTTIKHVDPCTKEMVHCVQDLPSAPQFFVQQLGSLFFCPVMIILVGAVVVLSLLENKK